ncbi:FAD-dependent oxidoreductase [Sphingomonas bacterium]|uniref:FAD-dependent oxidoreductase n=1 Tax=Sphingomonas bacterium TaxID=1895847 RepID=UPI001C2DC5E4|nr:FAD-dependent oxidoreductase [Sphingomonas bacterium]
MADFDLSTPVNRRRLMGNTLLSGLGMMGLGGCATMASRPPSGAWEVANLAPVRAKGDRVFDITVCLRPFRAAGPRLDTEMVGDKLVVHNYGHGGSGWSLSWGSGNLAVGKAMAAGHREVAVIGCGALGLTAAVLAQRAGAKVTIYAKDLLPQARSARATGSWTPDSRIALGDAAGPAFGATWEEMARFSFKQFRNYLGLPGEPVEWSDRYTLSDHAIAFPRRPDSPNGMLEFGHYNDRVQDLTPRNELLAAGSTPFDAPFVYRSESLQFNIADYGHTLLTDFFAAGGQVTRAEFQSPADFASVVKERVIINCPGYGARAMWKDESVVPVRGQIAWLIPQPEVRYGVSYKEVSVLSRRDGIVVQAVEGGDMKGYNDTREVPDRVEADTAVGKIADLFSRFGMHRRPVRA